MDHTLPPLRWMTAAIRSGGHRHADAVDHDIVNLVRAVAVRSGTTPLTGGAPVRAISLATSPLGTGRLPICERLAAIGRQLGAMRARCDPRATTNSSAVQGGFFQYRPRTKQAIQGRRNLLKQLLKPDYFCAGSGSCRALQYAISEIVDHRSGICGGKNGGDNACNQDKSGG
jgi:hypothetical protein